MFDEMSAWVGCIACYNCGFLTGEWVNAFDCETVTPEDIHPEGFDCSEHEELWVFDHEGMNIEGECSLNTVVKYAKQVQEDYNLVGDLYHVYAEYNRLIGADAHHFLENYYGCFSSETEFAESLVAESCTIPADLENYIDWEKLTRDIMFDFTAIELAWNEVHIVR